MMGEQFLMEPDWAIIGIRWDKGVAIIASDELTYGELSIEWNDIVNEYFGRYEKVFAREAITPDIQARVQARKIYWFQGPDYETVFADLMKHWTPKTKAEKQIEAPKPAISAWSPEPWEL